MGEVVEDIAESMEGISELPSSDSIMGVDLAGESDGQTAPISSENSNLALDVKLQNPVEWLETLDTAGRMAAMGFTDKTFLAALARVVASLSKAPGNGVKPLTDGHSREDTIDWELPVAKEVLFEIMNLSVPVAEKTGDEMKSTTVPQEANQPGSVQTKIADMARNAKSDAKSYTAPIDETSAQDVIDESVSNVPPVNESVLVGEKEEFRIRSSGSQSFENQNGDSVEVETNGMEVSKVEESAPITEPKPEEPVELPSFALSEQEKERLQALLKNVYVFFPSMHVDSEPVVTIHPDFLEKSSNTFVKVLDDFVLSNKSLKGDLSLALEDSLHFEMKDTASLPLYVLLLLRFQKSTMEAFNTHHKPSTPPATSEEVEEEVMVHTSTIAVKREKPSNEKFEDGHVEKDAKNETKTLSETVTPNSTEPGLVEETIQEERKEDTEPDHSPFMQLSEILSRNDMPSISLESLFQKFLSTDQEDFPRWLESLDKQLAGIADEVEHGEKNTADRDSEKEIKATTLVKEKEVTPIEEDIELLIHNIENSGSATSASKKSARRRKKKKKRKSANNSNSGNALFQSEQQENDSTKESDEDQKEDGDATDKDSPPAVSEVTLETEETSNEPAPSEENAGEVETSRTLNADKSISDDTEETTSDSTTEEQVEENETRDEKKDDDDGLHISRVDGVGTVVVTPSLLNEANSTGAETKVDSSISQDQAGGDDHDDWETVEIRTRGNRKKNDRGTSNRFATQNSSNNGGASKKKAPRNSESRKRNAKRKMVREILSSVLDAVDEQVRRRRQNNAEISRPTTNAWTSNNTQKIHPSQASVSVAPRQQSEPSTARTSKPDNSSEETPGVQATKASAAAQQGAKKATGERLRQRTSITESPKKRKDKARNTTAADQNTAPTVPETISAVSTSSPLPEREATKNSTPNPAISTSESSSVDSVEDTKQQSNATQVGKETNPVPPLPTLLSPGNANSATSSVASSLDAPHGVHHNHHSGNEKGVGYHLLHVCDRLTRDIGQFMKCRDQALKIRRRERKLVLGALQETVSRIFPGISSVEMYGSCATNLDLPSSDLDVVVCGLDKQEVLSPQDAAQTNQTQSETPLEVPASKGRNQAHSEGSLERERQQHLQRSPQQHTYMMYSHMSPNADRVVRLAMDLERQPWAVQVKAIPTASVPVIKILADPARLAGGPSNASDEWLLQHSMTQPPTSNATSQPDGSESVAMYPGTQGQPWRGADVVNGLMKVDITFEGPEHGGIGSTKFSAAVMKEFSKETGLPEDSTPAVQVLMVLKELLAQRRLNEPFSGGLSSYALLLLVISVVRERSIIRQELERVEKQRRMVAAGGGNAVPRPVTKEIQDSQAALRESGATEPMSLANMLKQQSEQGGNNNTQRPPRSNAKGNEKAGESKKSETTTKKNTQSKASTVTNEKMTKQKPHGPPLKKGSAASSSWASIAKKTSGPAKKESAESENTPKTSPAPVKKVSSFADAVAKGKASNQRGQIEASSQSSAKPSESGTTDSAVGTEKKKAKGQVQTDSTAKPEDNKKEDNKKGAKGKQAKPSSRSESKSTVSKEASSATKPNGGVPSGDSGSLFPQGFHDVIEVLCSGETTPGKLLMHFLLFYGQHFDSHSTAIDYSGTHQRIANANNGYSVASPYLQRRNTGSYDPMTGMLTVDPIVVYDPLVGAEANNVARSCFAWSSIRWVFAQSYMTLSSAVEMSAGNSSSKKKAGVENAVVGRDQTGNQASQQDNAWKTPYSHDEAGNVIVDPSSPILELLFSF